MDELIKALNAVKAECEKHEECIMCPLWSIKHDYCMTYYRPRDWQIELNQIIKVVK